MDKYKKYIINFFSIYHIYAKNIKTIFYLMSNICYYISIKYKQKSRRRRQNMEILVLLVILLIGIIELIELIIIKEPLFNFYNTFPACKNYSLQTACSANNNLL